MLFVSDPTLCPRRIRRARVRAPHGGSLEEPAQPGASQPQLSPVPQALHAGETVIYFNPLTVHFRVARLVFIIRRSF